MTTQNSVGNVLSGSSGTGSFAGTNSPTFVTPALGTPASGNLVNCTLPTYKYLVGTAGSGAPYTVIQTAINQAITDGASATTPAAIFIFPGTYTEDLLLSAFVDICGSGIDATTIVGECTYAAPTSAAVDQKLNINNLTFVTPQNTSGFVISGGGDGTGFATLVNFDTCGFFVTPGINGMALNNFGGYGLTQLLNCVFTTAEGSTDLSIKLNSLNGYTFMTGGSASAWNATGSFAHVIGGTLQVVGATIVGKTLCESLYPLGSCKVLISNCNVYNYDDHIYEGANVFSIGDFRSCTISSQSSDGYWATGTGNFGWTGISFYDSAAQKVAATLTNTIAGSKMLLSQLSFDGGNTTLSSNGQLWIGNATTGLPTPATLTQGTGISITNAAGSISIAATALAPTSVTTVTGTSATMSTNAMYVANNAGLVTLTLPTTSAVGDTLIVCGLGAGLWKIAQNAGQQIIASPTATTAGVTGSLSSTLRYDAVTLKCIVANTTWVCVSIQATTLTTA